MSPRKAMAMGKMSRFGPTHTPVTPPSKWPDVVPPKKAKRVGVTNMKPATL